jgi:hypothetical protein
MTPEYLKDISNTHTHTHTYTHSHTHTSTAKRKSKVLIVLASVSSFYESPLGECSVATRVNGRSGNYGPLIYLIT